MDEMTIRALSAVQSAVTEVTASTRALEKVVLALVAAHPHRQQILTLTDLLLRSDAILGKATSPEHQQFVGAYCVHGERLLVEMRDVQAGA